MNLNTCIGSFWFIVCFANRMVSFVSLQWHFQGILPDQNDVGWLRVVLAAGDLGLSSYMLRFVWNHPPIKEFPVNWKYTELSGSHILVWLLACPSTSWTEVFSLWSKLLYYGFAIMSHYEPYWAQDFEDRQQLARTRAPNAVFVSFPSKNSESIVPTVTVSLDC